MALAAHPGPSMRPKSCQAITSPSGFTKDDVAHA